MQPFSISDTLKACEGIDEACPAQNSPLRVLVRNAQGVYEVVRYREQPYVAISYCWPGPDFRKLGVSNESTPVLTSKGIIQSQHFSRFISRAVESYDASLAVWIDYHCIDQDSVEEKTAQVAIMQRIYTKAKITLVVLEDKALSAEEQQAAMQTQSRADPTRAARAILSARWFSRAWCSQELVLSHHVHIYVHSKDGGIVGFPADMFWHCVDRARFRDPAIPVFRVSRGRVSDATMAKSTCIWALGIVHRLGCSDDYDKIALVCNLVRFVYRFASRPTAFNAHSPTIHLNGLEMVNVIALKRRDFSLLLANHGVNNPFRGHHGFGWAGEPIDGDRCSELWKKEDYRSDEDQAISLDSTGLMARGCLARIVVEHTWELRRDGSRLQVTLDGVTHILATMDVATHASWTWTYDTRHLQDLMLALTFVGEAIDSDASRHARIVFAYLVEEDYEQQPEPILSDLAALTRSYLGNAVSLKDIAAAMGFIWREPGRAVFSTVAVEEGSVLLVSGNVDGLAGRLLFQPCVVRPRLFSPPMVLTVNSMVLESECLPTGALRCIGCVRGLGMIPDVAGLGASTVHVV